MTRLAFALGLAVLLPPAGRAADPVDTTVLSAVLRDLLVQNLPTPALESKKDWGRQKEVFTGMKFRKVGPVRWEPEPQKGMRNDGHWQVFRGTVEKPGRTLKLTLRDVANPEPGKTTFRADLASDVAFGYEQQIWKMGARLYSGETRGTCKMAVALACEVTNRIEVKADRLAPDLVFRVRVTAAELSYSDLKIDHTLGVGGDAARVLGDAAVAFVKAVKPGLEKDLLAKANAAVVKAADTKDVRLELGKLMSGRPAAAKGK